MLVKASIVGFPLSANGVTVPVTIYGDRKLNGTAVPADQQGNDAFVNLSGATVTFYGDGGDDYLESGVNSGSVTMYGGAGNDTLIHRGAIGATATTIGSGGCPPRSPGSRRPGPPGCGAIGARCTSGGRATVTAAPLRRPFNTVRRCIVLAMLRALVSRFLMKDPG